MSKRPKIYINGRFLTRKMTGVERFAYSICRTMRRMGQPFTLLCPHAPIQDCYDTDGMDIVRYGRGNSHVWEQLVLPFFFIGKKDYVLCSFTGLGTILVGRKIMTIHDLSFLENPKWFSRGYYMWYKVMTPLAARTSRHILTVSQFSKGEIHRFYPFLSRDKVSVVYSAVDTNRFKPNAGAAGSGETFALTVSSLDPRKNFARLVEAFKGVRGCKLYIVGNANRVFGSQSALDEGNPNIRLLGRVSDEELVSLYQRAACFVFPSVYEGFGLPPLEAMACGCPVLASDIPVVREVCADAAMYFNPLNIDSIRHTIEKYLEGMGQLKLKMQKRGFDNVERFRWEKVVRDVMVAVEKCVE